MCRHYLYKHENFEAKNCAAVTSTVEPTRPTADDRGIMSIGSVGFQRGFSCGLLVVFATPL